MRDRREEIMTRMLVALRGVKGVSTLARNKTEISDEAALPAILLLDGNEVASINDPPSRPVTATRRMTLTPDIRIICATSSDSVGKQINALRMGAINALITDETLVALTADATGLRYEGSVVTLKSGRVMTMDLSLQFSCSYYLTRPDITGA